MRMMRIWPRAFVAALAAGGLVFVATSPVSAQPVRKGPQPAGKAGPATPEVAPASTTPPESDRLATELLKVSPSGLTAEQVGTRAAATSYQAKAAEESLRAAAAAVDAAFAQFLPRITGTARYTRYSNLTMPVFAGFTFPKILDNSMLQASIVIPISDYFLRLNQQYSAATHAGDAARFDAGAAKAKASADGRVAFYTWLRARSAVIVATQALEDQRTHLTDAKNQFTVGNASKADVLRAETAVAAAELTVEKAKNLADLTEKQVRIAMHQEGDTPLTPGEGLDNPPAPFSGNLKTLTEEAMTARFEVKSIDANAEAARRQSAAQRGSALPQVSAFGDALYASPNQRKFPTEETWFPTWQVGIQAVWSPNDVATGLANGASASAKAAALDAQRMATRDGIDLEVMQAMQAIKEADVALETTKREVASATEAHRVARELFNAGRGTSTTLADAETDLTRARLNELNAKVDARIARVKMEHALGRDTKSFQQP
jgi:outer membrane protein TolC